MVWVRGGRGGNLPRDVVWEYIIQKQKALTPLKILVAHDNFAKNYYETIIFVYDTYNATYLEDFDENFDRYHSLKPDFKYYKTEQFHNMKDKIKDSFCLLRDLVF